MSASSGKKGNKRTLDTSSVGQSLWLVKIPSNVSEAWRSAEQGDSLGSLSIESLPSNTPGKKPRSKVSVQLRSDMAPSCEGGGSTPLVTEFTLDEMKNASNTSLAVFDTNKEQDSFSVKGHISTFWTLTPKDNEQYRQAVKHRQLAASTKVRGVKSIDSRTVFENTNNKAQEVDFKAPAYVSDRKRESEAFGGAAPRRARGEKATEKEVQELKKKLLEVFGEREYLTFKEINAYCQAYEPDLRELVKKYCDYHAKGPLKTYYELKAEYKGKKK